MENIFSKLIKFGAVAAAFVITALVFAKVKINQAKAVLACNKGEGFVDTAVKILIAVVIGALVLAGLYLLFNGTILPTITTKIQEMFNYGGS
jgi:multisubunit Na+/H+ antiporter MnhB subunit